MQKTGQTFQYTLKAFALVLKNESNAAIQV